MIQLHLLDLALKQFPNLNFDNEEDIIRIEKILKGEAKLNSAVKINDIEHLITFLKAYGNKFIPILKNKNVAIIVGSKLGNVNFARFDRENIAEATLLEFANVFSKNTSEYIKSCIRNGKWNSLKSIFTNYNFIVSDEVRDEAYQALSTKNENVISAVHNDQYVGFVNANPYASEIQYYSMLSAIDQHYFDNEILSLNNVICENQNTTVAKKAYLGKILYAASYFNAYSEGLKEILEGNQPIAMQWIYPHENISKSNSSTSATMTITIILAIVSIIIFAVITDTPQIITPTIIVVGFLGRIMNAIKNK